MGSQQNSLGAALLVRRNGETWDWSVVEPDGTVCATGVASNQDAAMAAAWATSRESSTEGVRGYPNIILGYE